MIFFEKCSMDLAKNDYILHPEYHFLRCFYFYFHIIEWEKHSSNFRMSSRWYHQNKSLIINLKNNYSHLFVTAECGICNLIVHFFMTMTLANILLPSFFFFLLLFLLFIFWFFYFLFFFLSPQSTDFSFLSFFLSLYSMYALCVRPVLEESIKVITTNPCDFLLSSFLMICDHQSINKEKEPIVLNIDHHDRDKRRQIYIKPKSMSLQAHI